LNPLSRFEKLAEHLVEGAFGRWFAGQLHPLEVATQLARAMEDAQALNLRGEHLAPNIYWVYLNPADYDALRLAQPTLPEDLTQSVVELAAQAELVLAQRPVVEVHSAESIPRRQVSVAARYVPPESVQAGVTSEMSTQASAAMRAELARVPDANPFLILDGRQTVPLTRPIVTLGRSLDNDVIVHDVRVSRHHVQLRRRAGRYVIYDLGSSGGTLVNGDRVSECLLQPGDVINLAGVQIIYGEDALTPPAPPNPEDTPSLPNTKPQISNTS
jgi:pSer/pThr/pTyr-binding forkhead associated (FHA) protein